MTKCKECGNEISTKADACPKCGAKQVKTSGCAKFVLGFIIFVVFVAIVGQCSDGSNSPKSQPTSKDSVASKPVPKKPGDQWRYTHASDEMTKGVTHTASVVSTNTVEFSFPYHGPQHATLTLRSHPRHGKDAILQIERGQFLCRSYEDCNVLVRFDEKQAVNYRAAGASDNSSEVIFLRNYSAFVGELQKAKRVRIAAEIYQQGAPVFDFDVSGFSVEQYKQGK